MSFFNSLFNGIGDVISGNWGDVITQDIPGLFTGNDSGTTAAVINAGANLIGGKQAQDATASSIAQQEQFQQQSINQQESFQERMSSTAYQRAVQDMEAAGLNPMLAAVKGGASSPSGGSASGGSFVGQNIIGNAANSAMDARVKSASVDQIASATNLNHAQASAAVAQANLSNANAAKAVADLPTNKLEGSFSQTATDIINKVKEVGSSVSDWARRRPAIEVHFGAPSLSNAKSWSNYLTK